jgi:hypothetical protein
MTATKLDEWVADASVIGDLIIIVATTGMRMQRCDRDLIEDLPYGSSLVFDVFSS